MPEPAVKAARPTKPRRETLNVKIPPAERTLIDRAAQSVDGYWHHQAVSLNQL
jgi:hypothetical protein